MTEREKMLAGELYLHNDPELVQMHKECLRLTKKYNDMDPGDDEALDAVMRQLCNAGKNVVIKQPVRFDYGKHTYIGDNTYINYGFHCLDVCEVRIGKNVLIAPGVHIYAATHPVDPEIRLSQQECGKPVTIGNNVWIGGCAIICPGVTVGDNCTVGAGSVVTKDIPANSVAVGNPCRVIKKVGTIDK